MTVSIKEFLQHIHPVEDEILEEFLSQFEKADKPKKTIITAAGKIEHFIYFTVEGVQKSYYLNEGKEHVIAFTYPPSFSGIPESYITRKPSKYYLETITESRFLRLPYERHQELMKKHRPIETLFRKATERVLVGVLERHYELMAYSIEERFRAFMKRSSHLLNVVPHKDLASYLRIDPTNFSKLLSSVRI
ncbi:MAG: Crp/Fnr family transcriptional regulator [Balneolaceae bacterium]|nr:Crp/Fnr family transcriptional regulator [Balneolaceae bacterium]